MDRLDRVRPLDRNIRPVAPVERQRKADEDGRRERERRQKREDAERRRLLEDDEPREGGIDVRA